MFCNNKNVLRAQSMVWHFVHHPVCVFYAHFMYVNLDAQNEKLKIPWTLGKDHAIKSV